MSKQTTKLLTADATLRVFVNQKIVAKELSAGGQQQHRLVVTLLDEFLGRPALVRDVNGKTIASFFHWMNDQRSWRKVTKLNRQNTLMALARDLADRGLVAWPNPDWKTRLVDREQVGDVGWFGLRRYFEEVFLPDRQASGSPIKPETIKAYRAAISAFESLFRKPFNCHHCSSGVMRQFRERLLASGLNPKKAGNHVFAVAAIAKHSMPERFLEDAEPKGDADSARTLAYVFDKHFLAAKPSIGENSVSKYHEVFYSFGRHLGKVATLDDLTDENLGRYMRELRRTGRSVRTANGYRSKLVSLWNWCARKRLVEQFPTVEKMPEPATMPCAWTVDELRKLLAGCDRMPGTLFGIPAPDWWRALHYVAWDTGERTGGLLAITWQMLDVKAGQLVVPAEFRKGGRKPMLYRLKPATLQLLKRIALPERELMFPFPATKRMFYQKYKLLLRISGLPYVKYKSAIQKMRRSFATHLEAAGGNATEALAHSERSITEESYLDLRLIERTPPNELLFPLES